MRPLRFALFGLTLLAMACVAGGSGEGSARRNAKLITAAELADVPATTAFEAIQRLRPIWLNGRGGNTPVVFVDGAQQGMGSLDALRQYRLDMVKELRFVDGSDATMRWGTGFTGGVIDIITK